MLNKLIYILFIYLLLSSCSDNPSDNSPKYPEENTITVVVDSVLSPVKLKVTIDGKMYPVRVISVECFESTNNEILKNQALSAGISEDSALTLGIKALAFAKQHLLGKTVTLNRDIRFGNISGSGELYRWLEVGTERYDSLLSRAGLLVIKLPTPDDMNFYAKVSWIYDGDTIEFQHNGTNHKVRILGIDCYETQINERLEDQAKRNHISNDSAIALGLAAKDFAINYLKGKTVLLKRSNSEPNRDVYDRYLRWVESDGVKYDSLIKAMGYHAK